MRRMIRLLFGASLCTLFLAAKAFPGQVEFISEISDPGKKPEQQRLHAPRAIAADNSKFYIADTDADRVVVLDRTGKVLQTIGGRGSEPGEFRSPSGIAVDSAGMIYVADTKNHRLQVFTPAGRLFRSIGNKGKEALEFNSPSGIAVKNGLFYVADSGNGRIQVLTTDGIFLRSVAPEKDAMKKPIAVAVDSESRIFALDTDDERIRVFDQNGAEIADFGDLGSGEAKLDSPQGMAIDSVGNFYIADTGNYKLKEFNPHGFLIEADGSRGKGPGQFQQMTGMAIYKDNLFLLDADRNSLQTFSCVVYGDDAGEARPLAVSQPSTVSLYKETRSTVAALAFDKQPWAISEDRVRMVGVAGGKSFGSRGKDAGMLKNARGVAADGAGNLWVADTGNDRVQKFSADGRLLQVIGNSGSRDAEFDSPSAIAVGPNGNVYVADTGNKRVQVFTPKGVFLLALGKSEMVRLREPVAVAVDRYDCVYVLDRAKDSLAKFNAQGLPVWEIKKSGSGDGEFDGPNSMVLSPDGELYVLDAGNARVQVFDTNGRFFWKFGSKGEGRGQFNSPEGLALEKNDRLYVGDRGNNRVQVFTLHHTPAVPAAVSAEARKDTVYVSWSGNKETYLEEYRVYRSEDSSGPYKLVKKTNYQLFADSNVTGRRTYYYRVSSKAKEGRESMASAPAGADTLRLVPSSPGKIRIEAMERQMKLSWPRSNDPFFRKYNVYRSEDPSNAGFDLIAAVDKNEYLDSGLRDATVYYYRVTAVGKEGDESTSGEPSSASTLNPSGNRPLIEITKADIEEIFSSAYASYPSHPAARVTVTNTTGLTYKRVKVVFSVRDFMDFPAEAEIQEIRPNQQVEVSLKPVFNNTIVEVTETSAIQSEIAVIFYSGGEEKTVKRTFPLKLYDRHAMVWDQQAKIGAFVTPKDTPVAEFARAAIKRQTAARKNVRQPIEYARAVYAALGSGGMKYRVDPSGPREFSGTTGTIEYVQYPRDTLSKKSGNCDDLSVLFAASLENTGIETAFIGGPRRLLVMFNTGVSWPLRSKLGLSPELMIPYEDRAWIPVEMTMVGRSFTDAWQKGAEEYRDWSAGGKAEIISTHAAWEQFKPVTLPSPGDRKPVKTVAKKKKKK